MVRSAHAPDEGPLRPWGRLIARRASLGPAMRTGLVLLATIGAATAARASGPAPGAVIVRGDVVAATSRWTTDGSRIVTEAVVRDATGVETVVSQLGGHVGNLTMRTIPGDALLAPGMEVEVWARRADTLLGQRL